MDATHELPVAYEITPANESQTRRLVPLVERVKEKIPGLYERDETAAADRGYDSTENQSAL